MCVFALCTVQSDKKKWAPNDRKKANEYRRKHSIDSINWMIMVLQEQAKRNKFRWINNCGTELWNRMRDERVLAVLMVFLWFFFLSEACAELIFIELRNAHARIKENKKILQVLSFDLNHYIWDQTLECPRAMSRTKRRETKCTAWITTTKKHRERREKKKRQ